MEPEMETLVEAMTRLRAAGYTADFSATPDGRLECESCGIVADPATVTVDETVRFEGDSNPDDESILVALVCDTGHRGQYSAAFGPDTPERDVRVLQALPR